MGKFSGMTVVVTGGASGIGAAVVHAFLQEGAQVAMLDVALSAAERREDLVHYRCDVSSEEEVEEAFDAVRHRFGKIDIVVHSAARLGGSGPFASLTLQQWQSYIDVNLTGSFLVCRAAATRMIRDGIAGRIILIGSVNSFAAEPGAAPYVASKGGVRLLTRAAAVDLAGHGITVNMIAPGPITTPATERNFSESTTLDTFRRTLPMGRPGTPADIAGAALFLALPESRFITGTDILVDGGMFAQILN